jgi:hypothetical protein
VLAHARAQSHVRACAAARATSIAFLAHIEAICFVVVFRALILCVAHICVLSASTRFVLFGSVDVFAVRKCLFGSHRRFLLCLVLVGRPCSSLMFLVVVN